MCMHAIFIYYLCIYLFIVSHQAVAGGMHTACLTVEGDVYTFGCNDEGALGRDTSEDDSETTPAKLKINTKFVQISAGDSHTVSPVFGH